MKNRGAQSQSAVFSRGAFHRRLLVIFGLQLIAIVTACLMGFYNVAPLAAVMVLIVIVSLLAWFAAKREWRPVQALAHLIGNWDEQRPDLEGLSPDHLSRRTDADVGALATGLHKFASRISGYNERERNFTRDASHELRSPLTVIKMSTDMLADESALGDFGQRSVQRIRRASREMEALVEALLILARESDNGQSEQDFVVNDVLRTELADARDMLEGYPIVFKFEESARFSLHGSPRVFAVLCWQLIRHASQYAGQGTVIITVASGIVTVSANAGVEDELPKMTQQGFEFAIAQRISERFSWPLEMRVQGTSRYQAKIQFPAPLVVSELAV
jgi:two-component system, OmpR family, sensor histidine kinase QseC